MDDSVLYLTQGWKEQSCRYLVSANVSNRSGMPSPMWVSQQSPGGDVMDGLFRDLELAMHLIVCSSFRSFPKLGLIPWYHSYEDKFGLYEIDITETGGGGHCDQLINNRTHILDHIKVNFIIVVFDAHFSPWYRGRKWV